MNLVGKWNLDGGDSNICIIEDQGVVYMNMWNSTDEDMIVDISYLDYNGNVAMDLFCCNAGEIISIIELKRFKDLVSLTVNYNNIYETKEQYVRTLNGLSKNEDDYYDNLIDNAMVLKGYNRRDIFRLISTWWNVTEEELVKSDEDAEIDCNDDDDWEIK